MVRSPLTYEILFNALKLYWSGEEIEMVAGWTYSDAGMEPVHVVIYDRPAPSEHKDEYTQHERRVLLCQGMRFATDIIIEHQKGW